MKLSLGIYQKKRFKIIRVSLKIKKETYGFFWAWFNKISFKYKSHYDDQFGLHILKRYSTVLGYFKNKKTVARHLSLLQRFKRIALPKN